MFSRCSWWIKVAWSPWPATKLTGSSTPSCMGMRCSRCCAPGMLRFTPWWPKLKSWMELPLVMQFTSCWIQILGSTWWLQMWRLGELMWNWWAMINVMRLHALLPTRPAYVDCEMQWGRSQTDASPTVVLRISMLTVAVLLFVAWGWVLDWLAVLLWAWLGCLLILDGCGTSPIFPTSFSTKSSHCCPWKNSFSVYCPWYL